MKAILISDHAKWCALMMNGIKKIEVRKGTALYKATKKLIDEYGYAEFYVYCTKGKPNLWLPYEYDCFELDEASQPYLSDRPIVDIDTKMNGKVIFKFRCYKVEEIEDCVDVLSTKSLDCIELLQKSCLTCEELHEYLPFRYDDKPRGYAIHISDLEIFDKPKELSEFRSCHTNKIKYVEKEVRKQTFITYKLQNRNHKLTKAPQSWCYIETEDK